MGYSTIAYLMGSAQFPGFEFHLTILNIVFLFISDSPKYVSAGIFDELSFVARVFDAVSQAVIQHGR